MGISWTRFTEYDLECDRCHSYETVYTGDSYKGKVVNSIQTAIYVADFHRRGANLICGKCFAKERDKGINTQKLWRSIISQRMQKHEP